MSERPIETAIITVIITKQKRTRWDEDHLLLITVRIFKWDVNFFFRNWRAATVTTVKCLHYTKKSANMTNMSSDRRVLHQLSRLLHLFAESLINIQSSCVQKRCVVTWLDALSLILIGPSRNNKCSEHGKPSSTWIESVFINNTWFNITAIDLWRNTTNAVWRPSVPIKNI